jgi:hypothetical protein
MAKPLGLMSLLSRQLFSAPGGPRKNLKLCIELPRNELSVYVLKNSVQSI